MHRYNLRLDVSNYSTEKISPSETCRDMHSPHFPLHASLSPWDTYFIPHIFSSSHPQLQVMD